MMRNRALMGSNMMSQAVPLIKPEIPLVSTGMESHAAQDSGQVVTSPINGEVVSVSGNKIVLKDEDKKEHVFNLRKYQRFESKHLY